MTPSVPDVSPLAVAARARRGVRRTFSILALLLLVGSLLGLGADRAAAEPAPPPPGSASGQTYCDMMTGEARDRCFAGAAYDQAKVYCNGLSAAARDTCFAGGDASGGVSTPVPPPATATPAATVPEKAPAEKDYCDMMTGPAKKYCKEGTPFGLGPGPQGGKDDKAPGVLGFAADPMGSIAKACSDAAVWIIGELALAVNVTTSVDLTNPGFLAQYAISFAASAFLTMILWTIAVAKRAIRGAPMSTAISEAIGFLWMSVMVSAFTPLALYMAVSLADGISAAIAGSAKDPVSVFFTDFAKSVTADGGLVGGPMVLILSSVVAFIVSGLLWIELLARGALIYIGASVGPVVHAGLVDRALWHHVRRWLGVMVAIILSKPLITLILVLAGAMGGGAKDSSKPGTTIMMSLAILLIAVFASAMIYKFVPGIGDELASLNHSRKWDSFGPAQGLNPAFAWQQAMAAHGPGRPDSKNGAAAAAAQGASSGPAAGQVALSSMPAARSSGGGGGAPAAAPAGGGQNRPPAPSTASWSGAGSRPSPPPQNGGMNSTGSPRT